MKIMPSWFFIVNICPLLRPEEDCLSVGPGGGEGGQPVGSFVCISYFFLKVKLLDCMLFKLRQIGVPIRDSPAWRITNFWCLSRKVGEAKKWWFEVEVFDLKVNIEANMLKNVKIQSLKGSGNKYAKIPLLWRTTKCEMQFVVFNHSL